MANKTLPASTGYFNKEMREILKKGENKAPKKAASGKRSATKGKSK